MVNRFVRIFLAIFLFAFTLQLGIGDVMAEVPSDTMLRLSQAPLKMSLK